MHENGRYGKLTEKPAPSTALSPPRPKGRGNVNNPLCAKCSISRAHRSLRIAAEGVGSFLHRARSASRSKPLPGAVGGSRRFAGEVDESATGSVNFWSRPFRARSTNRYFLLRSQKSPQIAGTAFAASLRAWRRPRRFPLAPTTVRG